MPDPVHLIPCDAPRVSRRQVLARCGAPVDDVPRGAPTCPECLRLDAEDEAGLAGLLATDRRLEDSRGDH